MILAAIQKPAKIDGYYVVSGWFCDLDSCACDDHQHRGGTCKHMCGGVEIPIRRWVNIIDHRYKRHTFAGASPWHELLPSLALMHERRGKRGILRSSL